jgi:hypothetical protein
MDAKQSHFRRRARILSSSFVLIAALFIALPASAGSIFFGLATNGNTVTLTNQGNSTAFYPAIMYLLPDGRWESMNFASGVAQPAELPPGEHVDFLWPATPPQQAPFPLDAFRTVMVRFFDQAGSGFGQISFFNQPPVTSDLSQSGYHNGLMTIEPPKSESGVIIKDSWLLWPQEDGIEPLSAPVSFTPKQPPAIHIEWKAAMDPLRLNLGAGLPGAILLHDVGGAYMQQGLINGGVQGIQQRASWLDANRIFYGLAIAIALITAILMLWNLDGAPRERKTK